MTSEKINGCAHDGNTETKEPGGCRAGEARPGEARAGEARAGEARPGEARAQHCLQVTKDSEGIYFRRRKLQDFDAKIRTHAWQLEAK